VHEERTTPWRASSCRAGPRAARGASAPTCDSALEAGLALGLALLTKTTSFLFAAPFVALLGAALLLRHRRRAWRAVLALATLPPLLMAGHMARNLSVYGHPLADPTRVENLSVEHKGVAAALSNALRFSSAQLGGPSASWNGFLERGVRTAHGWLGLDVDDPGTTVGGQRYAVGNALRWNALAGSPAHLFLWRSSPSCSSPCVRRCVDGASSSSTRWRWSAPFCCCAPRCAGRIR
jgi:hypothetical protein